MILLVRITQGILDGIINATGDYNDDVAANLTTICEEFAEKGAY